jgi:hypothetical protein
MLTPAIVATRLLWTLHSRSPYFERALRNDRFSESGGVASFPDADPDCLQQLVQALYSHQVSQHAMAVRTSLSVAVC